MIPEIPVIVAARLDSVLRQIHSDYDTPGHGCRPFCTVALITQSSGTLRCRLGRAPTIPCWITQTLSAMPVPGITSPWHGRLHLFAMTDGWQGADTTQQLLDYALIGLREAKISIGIEFW